MFMMVPQALRARPRRAPSPAATGLRRTRNARSKGA